MRNRLFAFIIALLIPAAGFAQVAPSVPIWRPATQTQFQGLGAVPQRITDKLISQVARVVCSQDCFIAIQSSGDTVAVTTTGVWLKAGFSEYFITPLNGTISAARDTTNGTFYVTPMTR